MQMAKENPALYEASMAAAKAGASLLVEEERQAEAAQQAKQQRKGKKARQKQRKQVWCHVRLGLHAFSMHEEASCGLGCMIDMQI